MHFQEIRARLLLCCRIRSYTSFYAPCPFCTSIVELLFVVGGGNIYNLYTHGLGSEGGVNEGKPNGEETPALTQQMNRNLCFQSEDIDKVESRE